ncbi:Putative copper fist DNA-binding domain-containing protein [Septoria linicola]|uniref:Copper fist DNA-binding domain-containing protein n=1 Tax=Septoria linicola TaxID=215465 RepID=A0A9Q9AI32_9PEZI|nr:putative copper fist DNA-binding domain-containing protein [Septoria linicola]USW47318.1 Putative copper fist DNA-binding domain-containing protein [Septoria linicola]
MVVKEDGTKWACQSCLKGHRVSGCNHTDRELTLVPKKGRPVTQCQHCRLERKKRSAHVKCDCGEADKPHHPKEKCIHLREAEERAKAGLPDDTSIKLEEDSAHLTAVAEEQGCCCHHGGKCSCSLIKKDPTSKGSSPPHGPAVPKPRLETAKSDGSITVFANGHHKPVHRKNHAAHECGMPYKMPLPRAHTEHSVTQVARRSVDSLPLQKAMESTSCCAIDPPPFGNIARRLSKSEQPSPKFSGTETSRGGLSDPMLSGIDFSTLGPIMTNQSVESGGSDAVPFPAFESMSGVTDGSYDPWAVLPSADSMPNNNPFGAWATQFDTSNVSQPALTAASSGTQSEIDEIPAVDDLYGFPMPSIQEDVGPFALDTAMSETNSVNRRSLPPNFFGNADFSMSNVGNEWQMPTAADYGSPATKLKTGERDAGMIFTDWSTPTMSPLNPLSPRPSGVASLGRPQSQSVGPCSAPNDDLMKQLFPDIDVNDGRYMNVTSPSGVTPGKRTTGATSTPTSHPMEMSNSETGFGFVSQSWSDGSLSVPVDAFTDPYNLQPEYNSDFSGPWPYQ